MLCWTSCRRIRFGDFCIMSIEVIEKKGFEVLKGLSGKTSNEFMRLINLDTAATIEREAHKEAQKQIYFLPESPNYKRTNNLNLSITSMPERLHHKFVPKLKRLIRGMIRVGIYVTYAQFVEKGRKKPTSIYTQPRPIFETALRRVLSTRGLGEIVNRGVKYLKNEVKK